MADVAAYLKSKEGGIFTLLDDGSVLAEGKYYVIKDHKMGNSEGNVRFEGKDILRVGIRKYSSTQLIVGGLSVFGIGLLVYNGGKALLSKLAGVLGAADEAKTATSIYIDNADLFNGVGADEAEAVNSAASKILGTSSWVSSFLGFFSAAMAAAAAVIIIKYLLSHKRFIEINTVYGSFCINASGIPINEIDNFSKLFYNFNGR